MNLPLLDECWASIYWGEREGPSPVVLYAAPVPYSYVLCIEPVLLMQRALVKYMTSTLRNPS